MVDRDLAFEVSEATLSRIVLSYLRDRGHFDAMVALELQTGVGENDMGQELNFLQQLTLEGRWEDVLAYVAPLKRYLSRYEQVLGWSKHTQKFSRKLYLPNSSDNSRLSFISCANSI